MKKTESNYRWVILFACVMVMFVLWGLGNHPLSLYSVPITKAYGFPRSLFFILFSVINLFTAIGNLFFGPVEQKIGVKKLMVVGTVLAIMAYVFFYTANSLPTFYCAAAFLGISLAFTTNNSVSVLVNNWFTNNKGLFLGIVFAASGLGGTVFDIFVGRLLNRVGFKSSLGISGILIAVVLIICVALVKPHPPQQRNTAQNATETNTPIAKNGISFAKAKKTPSFWFMASTELLWGLSVIPIMANMPAYLSDKGFDPLFVSGVVMALLYAISAVSKISMGFINDRFGSTIMLLLLGSCGMVATLLLILVSSNRGAIACAVFMGIAFASLTVPLPLLTVGIFGNKAYGALLGIFSAILTLAGALATPITNIVFDITGSYVPVFIAQMLFFVLSAFTGIMAVKKRPKWDRE